MREDRSGACIFICEEYRFEVSYSYSLLNSLLLRRRSSEVYTVLHVYQNHPTSSPSCNQKCKGVRPKQHRESQFTNSSATIVRVNNARTVRIGVCANRYWSVKDGQAQSLFSVPLGSGLSSDYSAGHCSPVGSLSGLGLATAPRLVAR